MTGGIYMTIGHKGSHEAWIGQPDVKRIAVLDALVYQWVQVYHWRYGCLGCGLHPRHEMFSERCDCQRDEHADFFGHDSGPLKTLGRYHLACCKRRPSRGRTPRD
jgi:hypothetical protein